MRTFSFSWQPQVLLYKMNVEDLLGQKQEQSPLLLFSSALSLVQLNSLSHDDERILIKSPFSHPFLVISRCAAIVKTVSQIEITTNSCKLNIFLFFNFFFLSSRRCISTFCGEWTYKAEELTRSPNDSALDHLKKKLKRSYALKFLHPTETISSSLRLFIIIA